MARRVRRRPPLLWERLQPRRAFEDAGRGRGRSCNPVPDRRLAAMFLEAVDGMHAVVRDMTRSFAAGALAAMLAGPAVAGAVGAPQFAPTDCPPSVADIADCHAAHDANGAWLLVAMPRAWNRRLLVHAHGGPRLGAPKDGDSAEDLDRFSVMVRDGYAWIGSTYRRGGYGVRSAA